MADFDVAVIGGGPNGLTAAAYLARAGAGTLVLEQRFERGGTLASDDYSTPFLYNQAQFLLPAGEHLPPYHDLGLSEHTVGFIHPEAVFSVSTADGSLTVRRGGEGLGPVVESLLHEASASALALWYQPASSAARALDNGGHRGIRALAEATPRSLSAAANDERGAIIIRYACGLAGFFDPDETLGPIGAGYVARIFEPALVAGGTKSLANGLFRLAARAGARCLVSARVSSVARTDRGFDVGLADGRHFSARTVISTLGPRATFVELFGEQAGQELRDAAANWRHEPTGAFTAHFGIKGPAASREGARDDEPLIRILGFSDAESESSHFQSACSGQLPPQPAGHLTITTRHDPLQASPGPYGPLNTVRYETVAPYEHPEGDWARLRVQYRQACWALILDQVPELRDSHLLFAFADAPRDLERRFTTTRRGSLRQGSLRPSQTLTNRPHASCVDGATPIPGVFVAGGATHPGVPGALAGGYHAAANVCRELGLSRWWPEAGLEPDPERARTDA